MPSPLRFLFASRPAIMGQVLGIVYRVIAAHLVRKAGFRTKSARTGAVTLIQRFGSALNLNLHFHMLFFDSVYVDCADGGVVIRWVKAPTSAELTGLALAGLGFVRRRKRRGLARSTTGPRPRGGVFVFGTRHEKKNPRRHDPRGENRRASTSG